MFRFGRKNDTAQEMEVNLTEDVEATRIAKGWTQSPMPVPISDISLPALTQRRHIIEKCVSYKFRTADGTEFDDPELAKAYLKRQEISNYIMHCTLLQDYSESEKQKIADVISNLDIQEIADALADIDMANKK